MANSYSSLFYHLIFSTKERRPILKPDIQSKVWQYIGGVARAHKMTALKVGGFDDHVHALLRAPTTLAPQQIAQYIKGGSSKGMHEEMPELRSLSWQDGYGIFSVSKSELPRVVRYIENQHEHHKRKSFKEEYLEFLDKHGVEYDERYLWG